MEKTTLLFKNIFSTLIILISLLFINKTNATVSITAPSLAIPTCSFPSSYSTLGNIVITEGVSSDFASNASSRTIVFDAPTNFQFNPGAGSITRATGKDISATALAISITATQITITYTCTTTSNNGDQLTISGIQVRATAASGAVNITRTAGTGTIAGLVNTTVVASLTSTLSTVPAQPSAISGSATPCSGTSQNYSVTNVAGTTYNWTFPAGWSQTAGGTTNSVTVTTNGNAGTITVTPSNTCGTGTARPLTATPIISPTITSTTPNSRDLAGTVTLGATASAGTISWYSALTGGSALSGSTGTTTSTYTTPSISANTTYYVEVNNGGCISSPRIPVVATVNYPEINIQGNTYSIGDGDTSAQYIDFTDFGESVVGVPISKTFLIQNTGAGALTVSSVTFTGTNPGDFTLTTPPSTTIPAGTSSTFVVTFNTATVGLRSATMNINNNDSNEALYDIKIQSTAAALNANAEIAMQGNGTYIPDGNASYNIPDFTDFGENYTGTPTTRNYTIYNTGSSTLTIGAITLSDLTNYSVSTAPSATVAPGGSTTVGITFNATTAGVKNATISIVNNDSTENPYNFSIRGTGVVFGAAQEIDILGNGNSIPDNSTFTSTSNFTNLGDSFVGTALVRTYTIKNMGSANLTITSRSITGTNSSDFVASAISTPISGGGGSTTFTITFTPSAVGTRTARISIINNDTSEGTYDFTIEGNGIAVAAGVSEIDVQGNSNSIVNGDNTPSIDDDTDFGSNQILTNTIKTFTIRNYGGSNLTLTGTPLVSLSGSSDFTVTSQPATSVASLGTTTFSIQFNPTNITAPTSRTAIVSIANNDSDENPYTFTIQGTAIQTYFDSDGDGVFDNVDIDDDNDGIKDTTEETNCNNSNGHKVNYKFLNETFGSGTRTTINTTYEATTSYSFQNATTPTDVEGSGLSLDLNDGKYTVGSSAQIASWADQFWYKGVDHTGDTNGRMAIFNASYTPGVFYTALITGALPNVPITYSFWVLNLDRTDAPNIATRLRPNIKVEFRDINDNLLATIPTGAIAPTPAGNLSGNWIQFTAPLTFNVNTFKVIFINNETGGIGNDLALDDISITQQLCDLDNDGIADVFDLDADNDGIEDVIEAGLGNLSNSKGKIDVAWVDVNGNGLLDSAEPAAALQALDSDGDGIPNYIDLDSDNDSLFDVDESGAGNTNAVTGYVNGDGDINGDGVGDGPESETFRSKDTNGDTVVEGFGDGILDIYDYGTGGTFSSQYGNLNQGISNANPATTYLKDTDGDGIPDYLDVKSNGSTFDIANTLLIYDYKTLDTNNDGIIDGTTDIDKDGIRDAFDTNTAYFGSPRDLHTKLFLDFDGRNDYGQSTAILGGLSNASLMAWIDLNSAFSSDGIIVGQNNFQIRISSAKKLEAIVNGTTLTYNTALNVSQWYNVAAVYGGGFLRLYLNGNLAITQAISGAISADASLLTIGKNPSANTQYFKGKIDEVRVFNAALTDSQLQRMVYQEIKDFGSEIRGEIVPKNVATSPASLPFSNLLRYYRMDNYKDDIIDDLTTPAIDITGTKIYNHKNIYVQQAPMPFLTERTGDFATAVNSPIKEIRGMDIIDQNWSIVKVQHDITETVNNIDLGMLVDSGKTILMNNDTKLQNDWYLKLDGKIDLAGKSQLVQTTESDLDVTSAGSIERDQQGQSNIYNYNYWSSPVSPTSIISNNNNYSISGVMKDGTNPAAPANINWISGYNGSPTSPISLARYWIFTFDNYANTYANWNHVIETTPIRVGQGFTLKGSGATGSQNYVFTGKPNNGTITSNSVGIDQLLLTGNPYPSSLNATTFISDNSGSIDGTLYFWEHYSSNNTHVLRDYQGGYAERNLLGGVAPVSPSLISGLGSSTKVPGQFIPVGQGFFVNGNLSTGGIVSYKNSQRSFHKEDETGVSNTLFKTTAVTKGQKTTAVLNNNDPIVTDSFMKIRLGYNTNNSYHRQVLLGFMNENATTGMDYGYDAINIDDFPNDMYFLVGDNQLVIQGVGFFDENTSLPIGVKADAEGKVSFVIDVLENFTPEQAIFIYDNTTDSYHNIRQQAYEVVLPAGSNDTRFSLRFKDQSLKTKENSIDEIKITHVQNSNTLIINNNLLDVTVENATLYNILGQSINSWKIENQDQQNIRIPVKNISKGVYIVKVKTSKGESSKKIIIN